MAASRSGEAGDEVSWAVEWLPASGSIAEDDLLDAIADILLDAVLRGEEARGEFPESPSCDLLYYNDNTTDPSR